ncbi:MAG: TonB-dependent receptor [Sulfurimonas sp.]|nr:TonB-dependent receptor [Sulfurimonas sp.]MDD3835333.1 TonB-dependent receptor [Sulfurimonas sp.]
MFEHKKIALSIAVGMALGLTLNADEIELNAIKVISAAGYEQKIVDAPASISVVSQEELKTRSYTTLLDAVREIEGVDIGESRDKTGQGSVSIRGMGGDYTLLLIDGKRQNNVGDIYPNSFGGNQQNHIPPLEMIERVEIIRGPMATLYGADAIGGVVNIITKKISDEWIASVNVSQTIQSNDDYGDDRTLDVAVMGPLIKDSLGLSLRASKYDKEASNPKYEDAIDPNGKIVPRELGFGGGGRTVANDNYNVGASLAYRPHKKHEIIFDIEKSHQEYDNSASQLGTSDSIERLPRAGYSEKQEFERSQWSLSHEGDWGFIKNKLSVYQITTKNLGRTLPLTASERVAVNSIFGADSFSDLSNAQKASLGQFLPRPDRVLETKQLTVDGKVDISLDNHKIVLGLQYIDAEMEDGVFGMTNTASYSSGKIQPHKQWALFAEENWFMFDSFTLTAGARYDKHDVFGSNTSPRIYGVYSFLDDFTIKGGVGTGYKTPKTSDLFDGIVGFGGQGTSPFIGNPDLKAEKSVNTEIAFYYENQRQDTFNITFFQNDFKDKIQSGPNVSSNIGSEWASLGYTNFSQMVNIDKATIKGIEMAGKYNINSQIALRANYTYIDSEQKNGQQEGLPLSGSAKHMYNAAIDYKPTPKIKTYLILTGEQKRYGGIPKGGNASNAFWYKDYSVLNAGASYKANKNVTITARINNLLDKDFTSYTTQFIDNGGSWEPSYQEDYNTKAKAREFWLSINVRI